MTTPPSRRVPFGDLGEFVVNVSVEIPIRSDVIRPLVEAIELLRLTVKIVTVAARALPSSPSQFDAKVNAQCMIVHDDIAYGVDIMFLTADGCDTSDADDANINRIISTTIELVRSHIDYLYVVRLIEKVDNLNRVSVMPIGDVAALLGYVSASEWDDVSSIHLLTKSSPAERTNIVRAVVAAISSTLAAALISHWLKRSGKNSE